MLSAFYADGESVPQNYTLAYMWAYLGLTQPTTLDAEQVETMTETLAEIKQSMTKAQIAEAEKMAKEWLKNFEAAKR